MAKPTAASVKPDPVYNIGLIADLRSRYFRDVVEAAIAHSHGMAQVRIRMIEASVSAMLEYADRPRLHGILAQPLPADDYAQLRELGCAILNFSSRAPRSAFPEYVAHVVNDDAAVGALAARHFLGMGLRHFAFYGVAELDYSHQRLAGYAAQLKQEPARERVQIHVRMDAQERPEDWIKGLPRPVGVFAANDHHARTLINAAVAQGLEIPQEIAVIGVDADSILSELSPLHITSIQPDAGAVAKAALTSLIGLIEGRRDASATYERVAPLGIQYAESAPLYHAADPTVARALIWLEQHLSELVSIDDLARAVGLSRRALEYRFRNQIGCAPYQKLLQMRLRKARGPMLRWGTEGHRGLGRGMQ